MRQLAGTIGAMITLASIGIVCAAVLPPFNLAWLLGGLLLFVAGVLLFALAYL